MSGSLCRRGALVAVATSLLMATASPARAGMTFNISLDDGAQTTTFIFPSLNVVHSDLGPVYTANGSPTVTTVGPLTTLNFNSDLSSNYSADVPNSAISISQTTDGHLVVNLTFDSPVSISASIFEGGIWSTSGDGTVSVNGGEITVEAMDPTPVESHGSSLSTTFDQTGTWNGFATTAPFTGEYTQYQLLIDNVLNASATAGTADIEKKEFEITISTGVGAPAPEPASLSLLALGSLPVLARRRR